MNTASVGTPQPRRETILAVFRVVLGTAAAAAILLAAATTRADVDLWGHVRFGMDILHSGRVENIDPYSFTSDVRWVNHEWLAEVLFAVAWRAAGGAGLIGLKLACVLGALAFVHATVRRQGVTTHARVMLLGLALVGMLPRVTQVRPQLFSALLFSALLFSLVRAARVGVGGLVWTVPLMALWTNLHGGWIVGLATIGLWALADVWQRRGSAMRVVAVWTCVSAAALATLLNPYGMGLWRFLLDTVRVGRPRIGEWGPIWLDPPLLLLWGMFAALAITAVRRARPPAAASMVIPAVWGIMALRVSRLDSFFALSVIALLGPALESLVATRDRRRRNAVSVPVAWRSAIVATAGLAIVAVPASRKVFTCVGVHAPWWPEPDAVRFVQQARLSGQVVTFFRWGEYAIWHLSPAIKVSMDGRRETVYSQATIDSHLQLYDGTTEGLAYLESLNSDYVWFPRFLPVVTILQKQGWVPVFQGPQSVLLASRDRAPAFRSTLRAAPPELPSRCFPGP